MIFNSIARVIAAVPVSFHPINQAFLTCCLGLIFLCLNSSSAFAESKHRDKLKVCADPYMLPFSNAKREGYENEIAKLLAKKLNFEGVEYTFFPQRMGFIRNTLRKENEAGLGYMCDVVISVPERYEMAAPTIPYYATTYMLVLAKGKGFDGLKEANKFRSLIAKKNLQPKIGVSDRGPAQLWVFYQELMSYMVPYQGHPGDPKFDPGHSMIQDIVDGKIQAAVVYGPTAGYYAKKYHDQAELILLPLVDSPEINRSMVFGYNMSMAVRHGEEEWKEQINRFIRENRDEIRAILEEFNVPLVEMRKTVKQADDD
ncbi:MAG: quinoprotein dehydrogenase-associated putative ABC transporter substrate-binding protein [Candidatus Eutrophobiaceae bacterium]